MKTPEELANERKAMRTPNELAEEYMRYENQSAYWAEHAFLAGYEAAMKQPPDPLADVSKVMPDSCEHILDMQKMVDVSTSATLNNWISVKDRLPENLDSVLITFENKYITIAAYSKYWAQPEYPLDILTGVTHWQPLPEPPKEEG